MFNNDILFPAIVFLVFLLATAAQLFYYLYFYLAVIKPRQDNKPAVPQPVSVIICARNEAENLKNFLPAVLSQDFPDFEVIVVNDSSEDDTYLVLGEYLKQYPNLKVSTLNSSNKHNKKFAQFIGIKASKNDILVFTDADCKPESDKWLTILTSHFDEKTDFVLGYGGYMEGQGLLNKYIRYDTITIAMQYLGMAKRGLPYMGVGRNLAYKRSVFFGYKSFGAHIQLASGDDDLFVNTNASGSNTKVECDKDAHTRSIPSSTLTQWIKQKKRHFTTAPYYKMRDKMLLFTEPASRVIFYATLVLSLIYPVFWPYALAAFSIRLLTMIITLSKAHKKLNEKGILIYSLIFDIFSPVIHGTIYLSNLWSKPGNIGWK